MHIIGSWRGWAAGTQPKTDQFPFIDLRVSAVVKKLEDDRRKLLYEGVIFDFSDQQLLNNPTLLERAFGYYTYILYEKNA